jgi:hypothetical protein
MAAPHFVGAADQILNQNPVWFLVTPSRIGIIDLRDATGQLAVIVTKAGVHQFYRAGYGSV